MTGKPYQGHRSWNAWNVCLYIHNEEPLYRLAQECIAYGKKWPKAPLRVAAKRFLGIIGKGSKTPDGGVYNFTCVLEALTDLE